MYTGCDFGTNRVGGIKVKLEAGVDGLSLKLHK